MNKTGTAGQVRVATIDGGATGGEDFVAVDTVIHFKFGELSRHLNIEIIDDEGEESDEEFFVQLMNPYTGRDLKGSDVRTTILILDNDGDSGTTSEQEEERTILNYRRRMNGKTRARCFHALKEYYLYQRDMSLFIGKSNQRERSRTPDREVKLRMGPSQQYVPRVV